MKGKDYTGYSAEQLLEDDFFLKSYFYPTDDSQAFWEEQAFRNEVLAKEIVYAQTVLRSIPYRKRTFSSEDKELLWKRISKTNHKKRSFRYWYSSVAAVAILLLTVGSFYYMNYYEEDNLTAIEKVQKPEQPVETVLLILADEKKVDIEEKNSHLQYNKKGELHINAQKMKTSQDSVTSSDNKNELIYNQLIVPSARRSFLELADGSKIWVNANTRVVYPVTFDDKKREIYVDGEIYIEVSPEEKRPFIVKSKKMDIRVLGTKFNVSTYESNEGASVVLVSGKVNVRTDDRKESLLNPSDRLSYEKGTTDIKKVNVENYISWKEGFYTFDNECFSVVLDKLSDYYGKKIRYNDKVGALRCSGSLNLDEDMVKVLTGLESTMPVIFTIEREYISVIVKP
ncbi:FecR family protein [Parabacteroides goldsteinii]|uniref:FecR family protein n=1 Tax=Parabacteroides goldsteinii TaxID=328812 RepID=UPI0032B23E28